MGSRKPPVGGAKKGKSGTQLNLFSELENKTRNKGLVKKRLLESRKKVQDKLAKKVLEEKKIQQEEKLKKGFEKKYKLYKQKVNEGLKKTNFPKHLKKERIIFNKFIEKVLNSKTVYKRQEVQKTLSSMLKDNKLIAENLIRILKENESVKRDTLYFKLLTDLKDRLIQSSIDLKKFVNMNDYLNNAEGLKRSFSRAGDKDAAEGVSNFVAAYKKELPVLEKKLSDRYPKDLAFVQTIRSGFK
ncbi:MAG: hypothetical protein WCY27_00300 [archaeon]|nr:hypothetical protein [archaeon]MDD2477662.1 hypothetical protein [Candidatus ainarchaeum sp.]MDD3084388.1 hypothetical protein [Candidatus ainarchaeum sp.]MDD4220844.1 hypothetical protein [Candidatus ainarchaeum sp.]MDD4662344.1 hypothetical protein [Candidatus ainarchaeum sp.]